jgi:RNA polymerase sigma factor (sigma-70 family)
MVMGNAPLTSSVEYDVAVDPAAPGGANNVNPSGSFATTRWTMILAAGNEGSADAQRAVAALCESYWYPVYAFVRRQGADADDAMDLTQGFFARLLEKRDLAGVERGRGRFRWWLLLAVKHYLANERDRSRAAKRGGGKKAVSIDAADAESRYRLEPSHDDTPERIFERRWALTLLDQVLTALREECAAEGKSQLFESLKYCLAGTPQDDRYQRAAEELQMTEGAVRMAAHRLRRRYRELLRQQIAQTVETPEQIEEEIAFLFDAVG